MTRSTLLAMDEWFLPRSRMGAICCSATVDLVQRLRAQHVPFEQLILPDEIHGFLRWRDWVRAYSATAEFFDRTLKREEKIGTDD